METNITTIFLKDTGYKTWMELYLQKDSYSEINGIFTFGYINTNNEKSKLTLPFNESTLKKLVLEESKLVLQQIGASSFTALLENNKNSFDFEIIVIEKDETISYKKISFSLEEVVLLSEIEKRNYSYLSYKVNSHLEL